MAARHCGAILQHLRRALRAGGADADTDGQLLERFATRQDAAAFETLLRRHGPMVFAVCRRVLADEHDAEDAFQATLLVLARTAATVRKHESVGSWLYGVAYRVATKARALAVRRAWHERRAVSRLPGDPCAEIVWRDLRPVLDEELSRLPEKYRAPVVLCYLEGKTTAEAAQQLRWPAGTVKTRLARARTLLRDRLTRRGCALSAGALTALGEATTAPAAVPSALAASTTRTALLMLAGEGAPPASLSGPVAALFDGILRAMLLARMRLTAAVLLSATVLATGAGLAVHQAVAARQGDEPAAVSGGAPQAAEGKQAVRTDLYGDPLPPGAVARIGSVRLRHVHLSDLIFSAGGKTLISAGGDNTVLFWDVATGRPTRTARLQPGARVNGFRALSPDGNWLVCFDSDQDALIFYDVATGRETQRLACPECANSLTPLEFSPDGRTLALVEGNRKVVLWDWKKGESRELPLPPAAQKAPEDFRSKHGSFSADGKWFVAGAHWQAPLSVWNVATGQALCSLEARAYRSAFSPDGKLLATSSIQPTGADQHPSLRVYDLATAKEILQTPLPGKDAYWWVAFSPDRRTVAVAGRENVCLLDARTGRETRRLPKLHAQWPRKVFFSPDGRHLAGVGANRILLWEVATGRELHDRPGSGETAHAVAYSPDGRLLATGVWTDSVITIWDTATGRLVRLVGFGNRNEYVRHLSFTTDGRTLVVGRGGREIDLLDVATGRLRRKLTLNEPRGPNQVPLGQAFYLLPDGRRFPNYQTLHLSPDGRRLLTLEPALAERKRSSLVCVWETESQRLVASRPFPEIMPAGWAPVGRDVALVTEEGVAVLDGDTAQPYRRVPGAWQAPLAVSPDGRLLAALEKKSLPKSGVGEGTIHVWETVTGKELVKLAGTPVESLALAADGRTAVTTGAGMLRVWDLATGRVRHRLSIPEDFGIPPALPQSSRNLYLSPDGRHATKANLDGTLLIWDIPPRPRPAAASLTAEQATSLWDDLASADAAKGYAAVWKLTDAPAAAVALLRKNLKPAPAPDLRKIGQLIRDLDAERFAAREAASKELEALGTAAAPALRQALVANPPLELRRRLEKLLDNAAGRIHANEALRRSRAVQVLERIGTEEARSTIETIARGAAEARETQEAKDALRRLGR